MNTSEIESLLEKFYEGNTTLQEEEALKRFFTGKDVPSSLKEHQPLFSYYVHERNSAIADPAFNHKLDAQLPGQTVEHRLIPISSGSRRTMFIVSIAASVLLLIGLFFTFRHDIFQEKYSQAGNPDPKAAYADASGALLLVSGNLNNGLKHLERLQMVDKAMKNMQLFNKFYQYQTLIINPDEIVNQSIKSK